MLSQLVVPARKAKLKPKYDNFEPNTKTIDESVPTVFKNPCLEKLDAFTMSRLLDSSRSTDHTSVMLPPCPPAVMVTSRVPVPPAPARHRTAVSDLQPVASHLVDPTRTVEL